MKNGLMKITAALAAILLSTSAFADQVVLGGGGAGLQGVLDGITTSGPSSIDVNTDQVDNNGGDELWQIGGSGGSVATIVIELAGYAGSNTFGIYDASNPAKTVQLFAGADGAGDQTVVSIKADGSVFVNIVTDTGIDFAANAFGFYLGSPEGMFYSQTSLNDDGVDHMVAFQGVGDEIQLPGLAAGPWGANEYILGFEDLYGGGDRDYADFVVLVESISPVPAPGALALLGLGLVGFGAARRRKA